MIRKLLVRAAAVYYVALGLWKIVEFIRTFSVPPQSDSTIFINVSPLTIGFVLIGVGVSLFQFEELVRKVVLGLLSIQILGIAWLIAWILSLSQKMDSFGWEFSGKTVFETKNPYMIVLILFAWIVITLLLIVFLMQKNTKKLFMPEPHITETTPAEDIQPTTD